jgi:hypothetical protein
VWGHQFVSESVLKTTISDLRSALQDDPKQARYIETVSRRGYRFIGTLTDVTKPLAPAPVLKAPGPQNEPLSAAAQDSIGRAKVLARLNTAWGAAAAGRRQVVWVSGEAGVGKTTVVERFMREVGEARCAYGHCVEQYGAGEPHLPILEALTDLSHRDASLVDLIRAVAPTWLFQLPWLAGAEEREALRRELSGAGQARMLREMGELLDRYTEQRPLLLVTEDLHWSDPATVQLMDYLARRRSRARLLWLGSFRVTELIAAEHPLATVRHELRLHGLGTELVLDDFSVAEVGEYLAARVPALEVEPALVRALHDRTDGLPLFVAGVIDDLVGHPAPEGDPQARLAAMAIPETLSGVIDRYIQELTPEQRSLLETASVCGVQFRLSTVARVLDVDAMTLADSCAELARRQRWLKDLPLPPHSPLSDSGYVFRHALYREVLYKRLGRLSRVDLHRKVAVSLEHERAQGLNVGRGGAGDAPRPRARADVGNALLRRSRRICAAAFLADADAEPHGTRHGAVAAGHAEPGMRSAGGDAGDPARRRRDAGDGLQLTRGEAGFRARPRAARRRAAAPAARSGSLGARSRVPDPRRAGRGRKHCASQRSVVGDERGPGGAGLRLPRTRPAGA